MTKRNRQVTTIFNRIRVNYFPRWDKQHEWAIRIKDTKHGDMVGYCDIEKKEIYVHPFYVLWGKTELSELIIHEICHAVGYHYHAKRFQARFLEAAAKAKFIGDVKLSQRIREKIRKIRKMPALSNRASDIYSEIQGYAIHAPNISGDDILTLVARNHVFTLEELLKRYRKAKKVIAETREWVIQDKIMEQRLNEG